MQIDPNAVDDPTSRVRVVVAGDATPLPGGSLRLEEGAVLRVSGRAPPDLPWGYHELQPDGAAAPTQLIVCPPHCYLPEALRTWGWSAQLYATRSNRSWGCGDLEDLRRLSRWAATWGAGSTMLNPLHADTPVAPQQASPYNPSSRRFKNVLYLSIEQVPGASASDLELESLAAAGRALDRDRRIDRDAILSLKLEALQRLWPRFPGDARFDRFRAEQGEALQEFATFCVLAEQHGRDWRRWPGELRRADSPAVARFATQHAGRVQFHAWTQWLLDEQLARAAAELPLVQDLPIGVDPGGADAWAWQDLLARGVSIGAPPDPFSAAGQDWGLPPFVPQKLRAAGYAPFIQSLRASLRHAGGLRIDHVMGLFRLFWVPAGLGPMRGSYVRYPADDLLRIVALESWRARAWIVGEDLGTVEPGVRERLAAQRILSYRVFWFEGVPPAEYPALSLASIGTHDLPTIAGIWSGAELARAVEGTESGLRDMRERLRASTGLPDDAPVEAVIERAYRHLGRSTASVLVASLEDALAVDERPNVPAAPDAFNWSLALPLPIEALETAALPRAIAAGLSR